MLENCNHVDKVILHSWSVTHCSTRLDILISARFQLKSEEPDFPWNICRSNKHWGGDGCLRLSAVPSHPLRGCGWGRGLSMGSLYTSYPEHSLWIMHFVRGGCFTAGPRGKPPGSCALVSISPQLLMKHLSWNASQLSKSSFQNDKWYIHVVRNKEFMLT